MQETNTDAVELNDKGIVQFIKVFKGDLPSVHVGVSPEKDKRSDGNSNSTIGAKHEFGSTNTPMRSFLRVPITEKMSQYLENDTNLQKNVLKDMRIENSAIPLLRELGKIAEKIVRDAFDSGGFGKWKPSHAGHKTLVASGQLRDSISSEVE